MNVFLMCKGKDAQIVLENDAGVKIFAIMDYTLKKSLGQHFLHDENICKKIVAAVTIKPGRNILEIGPGGGALTKYLLQYPDIHYKAIEIDEEKIAYLLKTYPAIKGKILHQDILKAAIPFETDFSIIGNFPYNISSPIMFKILAWGQQVAEVIGMFQKEVAQRIAAPPGNKTYGILSVLMQTFYEVDYLFDVHENCFTPPPKVKSGVVRFAYTHNPYQIHQPGKLITLVKTAFNQRRKTLRNAWKGILPPAMLHQEIMAERAEQLTVKNFTDIYHQWIGEK